jgi:hypothetical protein
MVYSKSFTIRLNTGKQDDAHAINHIALRKHTVLVFSPASRLHTSNSLLHPNFGTLQKSNQLLASRPQYV